jgi:hypothetical protein
MTGFLIELIILVLVFGAAILLFLAHPAPAGWAES